MPDSHFDITESIITERIKKREKEREKEKARERERGRMRESEKESNMNLSIVYYIKAGVHGHQLVTAKRNWVC